MLKTLFVFFLALVVVQSAKGQQTKMPDTLAFYLDNSGQLANKENADHIMVILPADKFNDRMLYPVIEYHMNGKPKLTGVSTSRNFRNLIFEGIVTSHYTDGRVQSVINYVDGNELGDITRYYSNGRIYSTEKSEKNGLHLLINCYDSIGTAIAQNGNGKWIKFDNTMSRETERGMVKDSLEDGVWMETTSKALNYTATYIRGIVTITNDPNRYASADTVFTAADEEPKFRGDFGSFLGKHISYPARDKENNVQGKVILTFVIEKDGSLSHIKILRSPDQSLGNEAIRVLKLSPPWLPGKKDGVPVRVQYTIPISFSLGDSFGLIKVMYLIV
jgi:TonB family protein